MSNLQKITISVVEGGVRFEFGLESVTLTPENAVLWAQFFYFTGVAAEHGCLMPCGVGLQEDRRDFRVQLWPAPLGAPQEIEAWCREERLGLSGPDLQSIGRELWAAMQEAQRPPLPSSEEIVDLVEEYLRRR